MSTNQIYQYLRVAYLIENLNPSIFSDGYEKYEEISTRITFDVHSVAEKYSVSEIAPLKDVADKIFENLLNENLIEIEDDPIAGKYYRVKKDAIPKFRIVLLSDDPIYVRVQKIGSRLFEDVFSKYAQNYDKGNFVTDWDVVIPASDRIVSLDHNQIDYIEAPLLEVIDALSADNGDPDSLGYRERILGQLKAGRELIISGTFRAWLLKETLLTALGELIQRYSGAAIGIAASKLLELLLEQIFKAA